MPEPKKVNPLSKKDNATSKDSKGFATCQAGIFDLASKSLEGHVKKRVSSNPLINKMFDMLNSKKQD